MEYFKKPSYKAGLLIFLLVVTSIAAYFYWIIYERPLVGIDDANIYFVYMRNLAQGNGFVYHPGGEHVEGFTSLLWVLMGSVFYLFTSNPERLFILLNTVLVALTLWRVCLFADRFLQDKRMISPYSILIVGFVFLIPGYTEWTILTMMETGLWSFILISLMVTILEQYIAKRNRQLEVCVLLTLLVITRPESYLWGGFAIMVQFFLQYFDGGKKIKPTLKPFIISLGVFFGAILLLTLFRMYYFGYPLPNTYYAKISSDRLANFNQGRQYIDRYFRHFTIHKEVPVICTGICMIALWLRKKGAMLLWVLGFCIAVTYAIPFYTGGDHFGLFRFIQPTIPLFVLFYVLSFFIFFRIKKWFWYMPVSLSLILIFFSCRVNYLNLPKYKYGISFEFQLAAWERGFAVELNRFFKYQDPYPSFGVHTTGGSGYIYKGETIDLLGLNNVEMAHASKIKTGFKNHGSFNIEVFYNLKPDLFFYTKLYNDTVGFELYETTEAYANDTWDHNMYKNIIKEPKFRSMYFPVFIFSKRDTRVLQTYSPMDFLNKLDTSVYSYYLIPR